MTEQAKTEDTLGTPAWPFSDKKAAAAKKTPAKAVSQAKAKAPAVAPTAIAMGSIEVLPQVRTEVDPEDLARLADSIQQHGLLQPILLRPNPDQAGRFFLIAGERRYRAAQLLQWTHIDARIRTAEDEEAATLQLVENIQREELSLADTAAGVLQLYEKHGNLKDIAAVVNKSIPWVSKHLSAARGLRYAAEQLLVKGKTEDLDLLLTLNQIADLDSGYVWNLVENENEKMPSRKEARAYLDDLKKQKQEEDRQAKEQRASKTAAPQQQDLLTEDDRAEREALKQQSEDITYWDSLVERVLDHEQPFDLDELLGAIDAPTSGRLERLVAARYTKTWQAGVQDAKHPSLPRAIMARVKSQWQLAQDDEHQAAYALGLTFGQQLNVRQLLIELREINRMLRTNSNDAE